MFEVRKYFITNDSLKPQQKYFKTIDIIPIQPQCRFGIVFWESCKIKSVNAISMFHCATAICGIIYEENETKKNSDIFSLHYLYSF